VLPPAAQETKNRPGACRKAVIIISVTEDMRAELRQALNMAVAR
jgi:hypothetical protein